MTQNTDSGIFACDFETTVYSGQQRTDVWSACFCELYQNEPTILGSIDDFMFYFEQICRNVVLYFHNLKFDGSFILSYLKNHPEFKEATYPVEENGETRFTFKRAKELEPYEYIYSISNRGQWYQLTIKFKTHVVEIRDSLKLLPFSLKQIGKGFDTKHQKLEMEYTGFRFPNCPITETEKDYISNDVLVLKEALEFMLEEGHLKMTIGSCCLTEYKNIMKRSMFNLKEIMPDLTAVQVPFNSDVDADSYIRKAYRGGWCHVVKGKENLVKYNGLTADVNSLYPSMMHSSSGNLFPIGNPKFWQGNFIPEEALKPNRFYFIRFKTRFYLKPNKLPFIQIKGSWMYKSTENLETSDLLVDGLYKKNYIDTNGKLCQCIPTLTMSMMDFQLMKEHYYLEDFEILDGCYFHTCEAKYLFDDYINKYAEIKMNSKGAKRTLAKLFLNNLYGKLASSTDSSYKVAELKSDGSLTYINYESHDKKAGYIPIGAAITSYARCFTIRAAQANYHGLNERGFIYADTDSIHCDLTESEIKGIKVHPTHFSCWKLENGWDKAIFVRQKTYIEHTTTEAGEPIEEPYYLIKCAGMPQNCKNQFSEELVAGTKNLTDFKIGLKISGKLLPKNIAGGILLTETDFTMR